MVQVLVCPSATKPKIPRMVACTVLDKVLWCKCLCCPPARTTNPKNKTPGMVACKVLSCKCLRCAPTRNTNPKNKMPRMPAPFKTQSCGVKCLHCPLASTASITIPIFKMPRVVAWRAQLCGASVCAALQRAPQTKTSKCHASLGAPYITVQDTVLRCNSLRPENPNATRGCLHCSAHRLVCKCLRCPPARTTTQKINMPGKDKPKPQNATHGCLQHPRHSPEVRVPALPPSEHQKPKMFALPTGEHHKPENQNATYGCWHPSIITNRVVQVFARPPACIASPKNQNATHGCLDSSRRNLEVPVIAHQ